MEQINGFSLQTNFGRFVADHVNDTKEEWIAAFIWDFESDPEWAETKYLQCH